MLRLAEICLAYEQGPSPAKQALRQVDFVVRRGERIGLCGPSGAGKSSLLLVAAGLYQPSSGSVEKEPGVRVGLALQEPETALFARSVREELAFAAERRGRDSAEVDAIIRRVLPAVGLSTEVLPLDPFRLPANQRRLVAIAAVLTGEPDLLLLDEPTVGLGREARDLLLRLLRDFPGTVVIASHDLDLLWRSCTRLAVLDQGRVLTTDGWLSFVSDPALLKNIGLELPVPLQVLAGLAQRGWLIADPGHDEQSVAAAILSGGPGPAGPEARH